MSVHNLKHDAERTHYTIVPNEAINSLKPKELGLYVFMLSKPENWRFREVTIAKQMGVSRAQVRTALSTLIEEGWVTRHRVIEDGKPILLTAVYYTKNGFLAEGTENERSESVPLSKERQSNKAAEETGAAAPVVPDTHEVIETGRNLSVKTAAGKNKGTRVERAITDSTYAARLLEDLGDNAPDLDGERLADNYLTLFAAAKEAGMKPEPVAIGLTLGLLVRTFGELPGSARPFVARLVSANGPTAVLQAARVTVGSGVGADPKWADDPLGPVRYLASVARGRA